MSSTDSGSGPVVINESKDILMNCWRTELNAPEILPYRGSLVEEMQRLLSHQETRISDYVDNEDGMMSFTHSLYQMDSQRLRYSLARYLRTRILKIENSLEYIVNNLEIWDNLSFEEKNFASKLHALNNAHFEDELLSKLQTEARQMAFDSTDRNQHAKPDLTEFVFVRAVEATTVTQGPDIDPVIMAAGDIVVLQYFTVRDHVLADKVHLI